MHIHQFFRYFVNKIQGNNISPADYFARHIIAYYTNIDHQELFITDITIDKTVAEQCENALIQLKNGKPLARILGYSEFFGYRFFINDAVLEPRNDSEVLIETALDYCDKTKNIIIGELGLGSGCLLLSLLLECPYVTGYGVDISEDAIKISQKNANFHHLNHRFYPIVSDGVQNLPKDILYDIFISNPPYIPTNNIATLDKNVHDYDPHIALDGGHDGLDFYRLLANKIKTYMKPNAYLICEFGYHQAALVADIFIYGGWQCCCIIQDYGNRDRVGVFKNHIEGFL